MALQKHRDLMTAFGGHAQACGMSFTIDQVDELRQALEQEAVEQDFSKQDRLNWSWRLNWDLMTSTKIFMISCSV